MFIHKHLALPRKILLHELVKGAPSLLLRRTSPALSDGCGIDGIGKFLQPQNVTDKLRLFFIGRRVVPEFS